jgi:hypothetical protein
MPFLPLSLFPTAETDKKRPRKDSSGEITQSEEQRNRKKSASGTPEAERASARAATSIRRETEPKTADAVNPSNVGGGETPATETITSVVVGGPPGQDNALMPFPDMLMSILEDEEFGDTIWWNQDGSAFCIVPNGFIEKVLEKRFQRTKFYSFTRKLNRWGFKRISDDFFPRGTVVYQHEMFQKGKPELLKNLTGARKKDPSERTKMIQEHQARHQYLSVDSSISGESGLRPRSLSLSNELVRHDLAGNQRLQQTGLLDQRVPLDTLLASHTPPSHLAADHNLQAQAHRQQTQGTTPTTEHRLSGHIIHRQAGVDERMRASRLLQEFERQRRETASDTEPRLASHVFLRQVDQIAFADQRRLPDNILHPRANRVAAAEQVLGTHLPVPQPFQQRRQDATSDAEFRLSDYLSVRRQADQVAAAEQRLGTHRLQQLQQQMRENTSAAQLSLAETGASDWMLAAHRLQLHQRVQNSTPVADLRFSDHLLHRQANPVATTEQVLANLRLRQLQHIRQATISDEALRLRLVQFQRAQVDEVDRTSQTMATSQVLPIASALPRVDTGLMSSLPSFRSEAVNEEQQQLDPRLLQFYLANELQKYQSLEGNNRDGI